MNAYSFDGILTVLLFFICTCAYIRRVKKLKEFFLSEKNGVFGSMYKASIIGVRLHWVVSIACLSMAVYTVFLK